MAFQIYQFALKGFARMESLLGPLLVLLAAATFGANPIFARMAYDAGADPQTFLFLRYSIASTIFVLIMIFKNHDFPRGRLLIQLILLGSVGMAGTSVLYYSALAIAPVNLVIVLVYLYPVFVTLLTAVFLKQRISNLKKAALLLSVFGTTLTVGLDQTGYPLGIALALMAALVFSVFLIISTSPIQEAGLLPATAVITVASTLTYGLLVSIQGAALPSMASGWTSIVISALLAPVIGTLALFAGIKKSGRPTLQSYQR
jgi:drug/metabolite transporter (DMT)-like permease